MELAEHCALFGRGRHVELSGRWLGDCLLTSAMCRMDRVPRFRPFASVSEKPRKVRVFPMLHSRAHARNGNEGAPKSRNRCGESRKKSRSCSRVVHALLKAIISA